MIKVKVVGLNLGGPLISGSGQKRVQTGPFIESKGRVD